MGSSLHALLLRDLTVICEFNVRVKKDLLTVPKALILSRLMRSLGTPSLVILAREQNGMTVNEVPITMRKSHRLKSYQNVMHTPAIKRIKGK